MSTHAGQRQAATPAERVTGAPPWWATAPRDGFTVLGASTTALTANTKAGRAAPSRMLEE